MKKPICTKHPKYAPKGQPRNGCQACWLAWLATEVAALRADLEARQRAEEFADTVQIHLANDGMVMFGR